jgi:phosphonate transport system permease protein
MKFLTALKQFGINFGVWLFINACALYIINYYMESDFSWVHTIIWAAVFSAFCVFSKTDMGKQVGKEKQGPVTSKYLNANQIKEPMRWYKTMWGWQVALALILTFVTGWLVVEINPGKFFMQFKNASGIVTGIFNPDTTALMPMIEALIETIFLALMSTVFAIPFAFFISFFAARNLMPKTWLGNAVYVIIRTLATIVRSIEAIVWAIIFCVWVGIGPFAGMLALWVHSIAALIKLYSEQIESIDPGPIEAIKATGAATLQVWRYAVIPQILSPYLAFTIYRWDINVRMATIVGFVGGGGIGLALQQQQQMLAWRSVGLIMWLIALVVWVMDMISGAVRQSLSEV